MRNRFDSHDPRFRDEHGRDDRYNDRMSGYDNERMSWYGDDYRTMGHERGFGMSNGRASSAYDHIERGAPDQGGFSSSEHDRGRPEMSNRDASWRRSVDEQRYGGRDAGMWSRYDYANDRGFHSLRSGGFNPDRGYGGNERYRGSYGHDERYEGPARQSNYGGAQFDRPRSEDRARAAYGPAMGRPPKGYTRSDERIREDVCDRVGMEHDASDVEVKVENGIVTLTGTVPDRQTKYALEEIAERVSGVKDVQNQVTLQRGKSSPLATTQRMESQRGIELGHAEDTNGDGRTKPSTQH